MYQLIGVFLFGLSFSMGWAKQPDPLESYNIVWKSPSENSLESMPCGGGDVGMNVWVEKGDLLIYLSRSGTFDELNSFPKLGRLRIALSPNPFDGPDSFRQELKLKEGYVQIMAEKGDVRVAVDVWADVFRPVSHIDIDSNRKITVIATYENWRNEDRELVGLEKNMCRTYLGAPVPAVAKKDRVEFSESGVLFYHRNSGETVFDLLVRQQGLDSVKPQLWNPMANLTYGGRMTGSNMQPLDTVRGRYASTDFRGWRLKSVQPARRHRIKVVMHNQHSTSVQEWETALKNVERDVAKTRMSARKRSMDWWEDFWDRSHIYINKDQPDIKDKRWQVARNYQVFRYQLGCNAFGSFPTKFNGGLFTTDPEYVNAKMRYSPDYRSWGGGSATAQNQRLVYWPMLKSGDVDMMAPQFDFYADALKNAEIRTRHYWGHGGASFTEQMERFGLPVGFEYGWKRPEYFDPGVQYNSWIEYQWDTSFEFCKMILDAYLYKGVAIKKYIPLIESCLRFYDEHYQYLSRLRTTQSLDQQGHLVFYPSTAGETYKMATNPITVITAMKSVIGSMSSLPREILDDSTRTYIESLFQRLPEGIHYRMQNGKKTLAPAQSWERINNVELPQLYSVYPWGVHGVGREGLEVARNTWFYGADVPGQKNHVSWHQDPIFCARLGLTDEAAREIVKKMQDADRRFPTFWGPGHDWVPDHNWGGSGMIALQEMLMQNVGDKIYLFPAWPKEWDVDFKLHAPKNTIVEVRYRKGKVEKVSVSPVERAKDIEWMNNYGMNE
ncbi:DUF5703 domain-containing protein [Pseudozobellia thermophila]|uniref:DUF5703 domain-containing protein n=1 Tax=Pseudozobellia thermophila TaxID=192903 RepID=A0A1M6MVC7_9FLAO|nr:DUF5703 domain-containing protein [Pseudozobellia thermophila]SHJ87431.1 hypothetical protein SAMN04488513_11119 [Pseudozobellia thermophila]